MRLMCWRLWLHTIDAAVTRLDRMLASPPHDTIWVPEAHPQQPRAWDDDDA